MKIISGILVSLISFSASIGLAELPTMPTNTDATAAANAATVSAKSNGAAAGDAAGKLKEKALVNLNTASVEDLAKLPEIGPVKAKAIVDGRPYKSIADLKNVKGIKDGIISKLKPLVTTN